MKKQLSEVDKIANDPAPPTLENTIMALEKIGQTLNRVSIVFNAVSRANTDDHLGKLQEEVAPKLAEQQDGDLNRKLVTV